VAKCCSPLKDDEDELAGVDDDAVARIGDGGGSGAAPVWSGCGSYRRRGRNPAVAQVR
jgi:hypothetical protein